MIFLSSLYQKTAIGWVIFAFAVLQIPAWAIYAVYKQKGTTLLEVGVISLS